MRLGVRLELTELPVAKSSKASNASVKSKSDGHRRQTAITHKPALAYLIEWKANQKGRRPLVIRLSSALVRVCAERGGAGSALPAHKTRLFPVDVGNEFMMKIGAS